MPQQNITSYGRITKRKSSSSSTISSPTAKKQHCIELQLERAGQVSDIQPEDLLGFSSDHLTRGQLRLLDLRPPPPPSRITKSARTTISASSRAQSLLARLKAKQSASADSTLSSSAASTGLGAQRAEEIKRVLLSMAAAQRGGRKALRVGSVVQAVKDSKVGGSLSDQEVRQGIEVLVGEGFVREVGGEGAGGGKFLILC